MREVVPSSGRGVGADPNAAWARFGSNDRALCRNQAGSSTRAERRHKAPSGRVGASHVSLRAIPRLNRLLLGPLARRIGEYTSNSAKPLQFSLGSG